MYSISIHVGQREEGGTDNNLVHEEDPGDDKEVSGRYSLFVNHIDYESIYSLFFFV
jgi:hypothetical protein